MRGKGRQSHAPPRNGRKLAPLLVTGTAEERGSETRRRRRFLFHFRAVGQWNDCNYFRQRDFHCLKLVHSVGPYREEPCVKHPAKHAASNAEWRCWRISLKSDAGTTGMFLIASDVPISEPSWPIVPPLSKGCHTVAFLHPACRV